MRCAACGTVLPVGALFCGECGRAVRSGDTGAQPHGAVVNAAIGPVPLDRAPALTAVSLLASTGQRFAVRGRTLVGRRPTVRDGQRFDAVLVLVDEGKTVSKSHLELAPTTLGLLVTDLGSGNGTVIETPGAAPVRCRPGVPEVAPRGARLRLGHQFIDIL